MRHRWGITVSMLVGWLVCALAIFLVALQLSPESHRSEYFWFRILWTEVLNLLVWFSASFYFFSSIGQKHSLGRLGGVAPTISIVTSGYAILSFLVMIAHSYWNLSDWANRIHWTIQIVLLATVSLTVVFLSLSYTAASSSGKFDPTKAVAPRELRDLLSLSESTLRSPLSQDLRAKVKRLKDTVIYSLSETSSLSESSDYQALALDIKAFNRAIIDLGPVTEDRREHLNSLNATVDTLIARVGLVSSRTVRA